MINRVAVISVVILSIFFSSCSSKFSLTKRHYSKGYHFDAAQKSHTKKEKVKNAHTDIPKNGETVVVKVEPVESQILESNSQVAKETAVEHKTVSRKVLPPKNRGDLPESPALKDQKEKMSLRALITSNKTNFGKTSSNTPYQPEWFGTGGGVGTIFIAIAAFIVSIIFSFLFFLLIDALISGTLPAWVLGLFILIIVVVLITIIALVIINGD